MFKEILMEKISVKIDGKKVTPGDDQIFIEKNEKNPKFGWRLVDQDEDGNYIFKGVSIGASYNPWASALTKKASKKDLKNLKLLVMDDETKEKNSRSRSDAYAQARKASEIGTY
jgi:hypothetical protein